MIEARTAEEMVALVLSRKSPHLGSDLVDGLANDGSFDIRRGVYEHPVTSAHVRRMLQLEFGRSGAQPPAGLDTP